MPCDTIVEKAVIVSAVQRLEKALADGSVTVVISAQGAVAFKGWRNNGGVADVCAYRRLTASNSPALRRAIMRAEALSGNKIDQRAVAMGTHSHDGGATWNAGH